MNRLTIKDIAAHFNVSISTVSKALNDSYEISKSTKLKIQEYAKEHNYKPNFNALSLKKRQTKTIGVIIPNMLNYFFAQVFKGVEKEANKSGYKVITCISNESFDKEVETIEMLSNGSIDGFLLSIAEQTEEQNNFVHLTKTLEQGLPIVMFDRVAKDVDCDKVITNDFEGAINAVDHLAKTGCKHIAFISTQSHLKSGKERELGYLEGLKKRNMEINPNLVIHIFEEDYKQYERILLPYFEENHIDSVITTDESSAIAAMKIAQRKGHTVPDDFSVISFSNGIIARHSSPKLTTVSQHGEIMGETAAKMLIDKIENKNTSEASVTKVIQTDLVERNSTRI
ncbi:LacI family transcriptional regulator [Polaribacter pacificus]|uniref:LacI family transcriptional regulator n=1 Tax=Polaribacter pacificus TaxID=1775173 RepID=A0A917HXY3_9FLAO|nr:LacI family DNA-binding transcriptional regulator [Polaribacter pacificus]GGG95443.1 LacI family transcriptional regulator [Polaribacter pacificus]